MRGMDEGLPYYDWNTGRALQPWAWLWDEDEEEEWEFSIDSHVMPMDFTPSESRRKKSISIRPVDKYGYRHDESVHNTVDKLCKNRKIIVIKNL